MYRVSGDVISRTNSCQPNLLKLFLKWMGFTFMGASLKFKSIIFTGILKV